MQRLLEIKPGSVTVRVLLDWITHMRSGYEYRNYTDTIEKALKNIIYGGGGANTCPVWL